MNDYSQLDADLPAEVVEHTVTWTDDNGVEHSRSCKCVTNADHGVD